MWLECMFLFHPMCIQQKGGESFQWVRCINKVAITLTHLKTYLYSVAIFHTVLHVSVQPKIAFR